MIEEMIVEEIELPEEPNLDFSNAKEFYVAGNEYDHTCLYMFIDRPVWDVDDNGRSYWLVKLANKREYFGLKIPRFIADALEFPDFDGTRSIVKINMNPESFFSKKGFVFIDGHLALR